MRFDRSTTLGLAAHECAVCGGRGLVEYTGTGRFVHDATTTARGEQKLVPCQCVLKAIFRICYARFRACNEEFLASPTLEKSRDGRRRNNYGRKSSEFIADFCLIARRVLKPAEHRLFKLHFLMGLPWQPCTEKLGIDRGNFYHAVYRVERDLGYAFATTEPYGLFPLDEYFGGSTRVYVDDLHSARGTQ